MAELVQERAQERTEGNYSLVPSRAHPERYDSGGPALGKFIQTVQFSPSAGRTRGKHFQTERRNTETTCQVQDERSADLFRLRPVFLLQCRIEALYERLKRPAVGERHHVDLVTLPISSLLSC